MPLFGKRRERCHSTNNVKPAVYDNSPPPPYQYRYSQQPAEIYQHYPIDPYASQYALAPTEYLPYPPHRWHESAPQGNTSCTNLVPMASSCPIYNKSAEYWNSIGDKFSDVISLVDEEVFPAQHEVVFSFDPNTFLPPSPPQHAVYLTPQHTDATRSVIKLPPAKRPPTKSPRPKRSSPPQPTRINVLSKVSLYSNSRLPASLPPLRLYTPTYPILCLAAQYSNTAYEPPSTLSRSEATSFVAANTRLGTVRIPRDTHPLPIPPLLSSAQHNPEPPLQPRLIHPSFLPPETLSTPN